MRLTIDAARLDVELQRLAAFSDAEAPAVTRIVYTETDRAARAFVKGLFADAGLEVREDAIGNTFARWTGRDPSAPGVGTGSHIDAIPNAGRYDGTVGVLGALEAVRALQRAGVRPGRSIDVVLFTSEEPTRFGIGCLGSRMLSGLLRPDAARLLRDGRGEALDDARASAGFVGPLESVAAPLGAYAAFVELHIEQGPLLEREGLDIGVVTAIAAPASVRIVIEGEGGHAGAVLMPDRRDAFLAAAEIALAVEASARATGAIDTVATTGVCDVFPGAVNSVPSRVRLDVDVRDIDQARRDGVLADLARAADAVAVRRRVVVRIDPINADPPATCDPAVVAAVAAAAERCQLRHRRLISRAYHDSLFMARIAPIGMIFVPCRDGVSHRPDEYSSPGAIANGALVLAETLGALSA